MIIWNSDGWKWRFAFFPVEVSKNKFVQLCWYQERVIKANHNCRRVERRCAKTGNKIFKATCYQGAD